MKKEVLEFNCMGLNILYLRIGQGFWKSSTHFIAICSSNVSIQSEFKSQSAEQQESSRRSKQEFDIYTAGNPLTLRICPSYCNKKKWNL